MSSGHTFSHLQDPGLQRTGEDRQGLHSEGASFGVGYYDPSSLERLVNAEQGNLLGLVSYGSYGREPESQIASPCPRPEVNLTQLHDPPLTEVWTSTVPVTYHREGPIHASSNGQVLFGFLEQDESPGSSFDQLTYDAYGRLFRFIRTLDYSHLLRIWNYFPDINREQKGLERYKQFCVGRHRAFLERQSDFTRLLPAATAVGTRSGPVQIFFLAGKEGGIHFENPRQVSAYRYPPIHAPMSPAFARATLFPTGSGHLFFVAGTSSIVGHESQHHHDPEKQTKETLQNLGALMPHAYGKEDSPTSHHLDKALLKVYIRNPIHQAIVEEAFAFLKEKGQRPLFLQGDICRRELLVEVEGMFPSVSEKPSPSV